MTRLPKQGRFPKSCWVASSPPAYRAHRPMGELLQPTQPPKPKILHARYGEGAGRAPPETTHREPTGASQATCNHHPFRNQHMALTQQPPHPPT